MISAAARPYIHASIPVLREHGPAITRAFYRNMFAAHPELSNLFNMGNQASGVQQQALAAAVFAYAANIDNVVALGPVIDRIVNKHASVGIKPEHYPIVGRYLVGAIQEILGAAATPALLAAWDEAYWALASTLIAAERKLYREAQIAPGQQRNMRVADVHDESHDVKSFVLEPLDDQPVPAFKPGQYVSVAVSFDNGTRQFRQYSLSDAPHPERMRISVKRESGTANRPAGRVSEWLHQHIETGGTLSVGHPFGDFTPDTESDMPIVLISAGVGITPMISVLNRIALARPQRAVVFAHAARSLAHHAHRADLVAAKLRMPNLCDIVFYEEQSLDANSESAVRAGRMNVSQLPTWPRSNTDVYLCGPALFMQAQWCALLESGVSPNRLHREVFGPELLDHLM